MRQNNHGAVSTDYIGYNWDFPLADFARREEIFQAHVKWQKGLMYFMATNEVVPPEIREHYPSWGLTRDEFRDCGGKLKPQLEAAGQILAWKSEP